MNKAIAFDINHGMLIATKGFVSMISGKIDELFNQSVISFKFLTRLPVLKRTRNRPLILLSKHCDWVKL